MPIPFTCPNCGRTGRLPDSFTGTFARCPACQARTPIASIINDQPILLEDEPEPVRETAPPVILRTSSPASARKPEGVEPSRPPLALIAGGAVASLAVVAFGAWFLMNGGKPETGQGPKPAVEVSAAAPAPEPRAVEEAPSAPAPVSLKSLVSPTALAPTSAPGRSGASFPGASAVPVPPTPSPPLAEATARPVGPSLTTTAAPSSASPAEIVQRIKDATVFLKVRAGNTGGSGSGFVFQVDGDTVLVATNHHVITPHLEGPEESTRPQLARVRPAVTAVFRSGRGAMLEQSLPATVIASDREGNRDLAILQVRGVRNPPRPIDLAETVTPIETMPVLIYGFPFGNINQMLESSGNGNPAVTINKGSVSSLRMDEFNHLSYVQIDGSLNPGNSGGPVVDEQGRLVGVAVAQISNTTIGFAVPTGELLSMLDGRVGRFSLAMRGEQAGQAELQVEAKVIDPLNKIRGVDLYYLPAQPGRLTARPNPDGTWPPLPGASKVGLALSPPIASAIFHADVTRGAGRLLLLQAAYRNVSGKITYGNPVFYTVPARPTPLAAVGTPGRGPGEGNSVKGELAFVKLGKLVDPARNCKLDRSDSSATIEVPAGVHVLSPEYGQYNAPMALTDIEGDFLAHVKIGGAMLPGTEPAKLNKRPFPTVFQGAGLVLWKDRSNYIRLERTVSTKTRRATLDSEVYLEIVKSSKVAGRAILNVPDGPIYIRLFRLNGAIQGMFGPDGKRWVLLKKLAVPFPDKVQVGISASNASKEPLSAKFEEFVLFTDEKTVKEAEQP